MLFTLYILYEYLHRVEMFVREYREIADEIYYDHAHDHDEIYDFTQIYYDSMNLK